MATVRFYLKNKKSETATPIMLCFFYDKKRIRVSTKEKIVPRNWNDNEQKARRSEEGYEELNLNLQKKAEDYQKAYRMLKSIGAKVNPDSIQRQIDTINNVVNKDNKTLMGFIDEFIKGSVYRVTHGTIKSYKTTQSVLQRFQAHRNKRIDFDDIDMNFYDELKVYQAKNLKYSGNTTGKTIKNLKVFMNEATERGLNNNIAYLKKGFKVFKEEIDHIYLTEEELDRIYKLDLSKDEKLEEIKNLFIVGAWTGLRFSDFSQIKKENIKDGLISLRQKKTDDPVSIPIHPVIEEIMQKYKGKYSNALPPSVANQTMNDALKIIGERVGLDELVFIRKTIAGKKVELSYKKYEVITTHTARRSFATNLYLQGFPAISIMKITGHRTEKAFMTYIKLAPHENAQKLRAHWDKYYKSKSTNKKSKKSKP
ncbi:MAG: site-specific integrase [Bacteroidia bacterium]|nr:site-specific integrase [Bacteroidia bacterium]